MNVYEKIGVRKVINANGTKTHLGGTIPDPRVMNAITEASRSFVIMMELIEKAGQIIAQATGAEDGVVTSGSSSGMTLAAAACIMKGSELENIDIHPFERVDLDEEWIEIIQRLPDTSWTHNEIIVQKMHRHSFDHAFKIAGANLVNVGSNEGCTPNELEARITDKTAAIAFTARVDNTPEKVGKNVSLKHVVDIAHKHGVPVIVDAASELPPKSNLRKCISEGADLVIISGGKHLGGPNDTGILCGRNDLIKLAKLQMSPYRGIGRGMKIDRTQIVGLITALEIYLEEDEKIKFERDKKMVQWMTDVLKKTSNVIKSESVIQEARNRLFTFITLEPNIAKDLVYKLRTNNPSIWVELRSSGRVEIDPSNLIVGEEKIVVSAIKQILAFL